MISKKTFHGRRFMSPADKIEVEKAAKDIDNLCEQMSAAYERDDFSEYNTLSVRRKAIGQRVIRRILNGYADISASVRYIKVLMRDYGKMPNDNEETVQSKMVTGKMACKDETMAFMLETAEKCGFSFIDFYKRAFTCETNDNYTQK